MAYILPVVTFCVISPEFCPDCLRVILSTGHPFGYPRSVLVWRDVLCRVEGGTNGFLLLFQIGITLQPVALHKNVYASVVEDMILKVGACWQQRAHELPPEAEALRCQPGRIVWVPGCFE